MAIASLSEDFYVYNILLKIITYHQKKTNPWGLMIGSIMESIFVLSKGILCSLKKYEVLDLLLWFFFFFIGSVFIPCISFRISVFFSSKWPQKPKRNWDENHLSNNDLSGLSAKDDEPDNWSYSYFIGFTTHLRRSKWLISASPLPRTSHFSWRKSNITSLTVFAMV